MLNHNCRSTPVSPKEPGQAERPAQNMEQATGFIPIAAGAETNLNSKKSTRITKMKSKKDINKEYKEREKPAGVFQVKNSVNGKLLLGSSLNLEGPLNGHKFTLTIGGHRNKVLQQEWNDYGPDSCFRVSAILVIAKTNLF